VRLPSKKAQARIPGVKDVFLLVEVADTSLRADRQVKIPMYARHGIPEVWLVDLGHDSLVVYRDPAPDGYQVAQVLHLDDRVAPLAFPDCVIAVAEILG
jgi:Uma2 family endonuclease